MDEKKFETDGFNHSKECLGEVGALKFNLERIRAEYEAEIKAKNEKQKDDILKIKDKIKSNREAIAKLQLDKDEKAKEVVDFGKTDEELEENAKKRSSRIPYISSIIIIIPLTLFLWLFYANAVHSLYIRDVSRTENTQSDRSSEDDSTEAGVAIINSHLFEQIFERGTTPDSIFIALVVFLSPSIFVVAGLLVYYFKNLRTKTGWLLLVLVYLFTFVFDSVIAYDLINKVEVYTLGQAGKAAVKELSFWSQFAKILFTSFAVYLMWGIVFNFIIDNHKIMNLLRQKLSLKEKEILGINSKIKVLNEQTISEGKKIAVLKRQIPMDFVEVGNRLHRYTSGWLSFVNTSRKPEENFKPLSEVLKNIGESEIYYPIEDENKN